MPWPVPTSRGPFPRRWDSRQKLEGHAGPYIGETLDDAPIALWLLDEGSAPVVDEIGAVSAALVGASVTLGSTGLISSEERTAAAFVLSGVSGFQVTGAAANPFRFTGNLPFSVEAVIRPTRVDQTACRILCIEDNPAGSREGWYLNLDGTSVEFIRISGGAVAGGGNDSQPVIVANRTYHVVGTYDGAILRIYVNGELSHQVADANSLSATTSALGIGFRASDASREFPGTIQAPAIYNYALDANQVRAHARAAFLGGRYVAAPAGNTVTFDASIAAAGAVVADESTALSLAASPTGTGAVVADDVRSIGIASSVAAVGAVAAAEAVAVSLATSPAGAAAVVAQASPTRGLSAAPAGTGAVTADDVRTLALATAPAGAAAVAADLTAAHTPGTVTFDATPAGAASVTAALAVTKTLATSPAGAGSVTAADSLTLSLAATPAGVGAVAAAVVKTVTFAATPAGVGSVAVALSKTLTLAAAPAGLGAVSAASVNTVTFSVSLSPVGSVTAAIIGRAVQLDATPSGTGAVTAQAARTAGFQTALAPAASVTAAEARAVGFASVLAASAAVTTVFVAGGGKTLAAGVLGTSTVAASFGSVLIYAPPPCDPITLPVGPTDVITPTPLDVCDDVTLDVQTTDPTFGLGTWGEGTFGGAEIAPSSFGTGTFGGGLFGGTGSTGAGLTFGSGTFGDGIFGGSAPSAPTVVDVTFERDQLTPLTDVCDTIVLVPALKDAG